MAKSFDFPTKDVLVRDVDQLRLEELISQCRRRRLNFSASAAIRWAIDMAVDTMLNENAEQELADKLKFAGIEKQIAAADVAKDRAEKIADKKRRQQERAERLERARSRQRKDFDNMIDESGDDASDSDNNSAGQAVYDPEDPDYNPPQEFHDKMAARQREIAEQNERIRQQREAGEL